MTDIEALWKLPDWVKPGMSFRVDYGPRSPNTRRYHICAIVDTDMVVMKSWSSRRGWCYRVESPLFITMTPDRIAGIRKSEPHISGIFKSEVPS